MKLLVRIIVFGIGAIVLLLIAAVTIFALTFDPNDYRDEITALVRAETGRDLQIEGDLKMTFFPWLGFEIGSTRLSNAPGFGQQDFASARSAAVRVKLMPLFRRQLEVGLLSVEGLSLDLQKRADGSSNWDDLAALADDDQAAPTDESEGFAAQSIGGIELLDASVRYDEAGVLYQVENWNLRTGALVPREPFDVQMDLQMRKGAGEFAATVELDGRARTDLDAGSYGLAKPAIVIAMSGSDIPVTALTVTIAGDDLSYAGDLLTVTAPRLGFEGGGGSDYEQIKGKLAGTALRLKAGDEFEIVAAEIELSADGPAVPGGHADLRGTADNLDGSLNADSARIGGIKANSYGVDITGGIRVEKLSGATEYAGKLKLAPFNPRDVMRRLGLEEMLTADPKVLGSAEVDADFQMDAEKLRLTGMTAKLDDSTFTGNVSSFFNGALRCTLAIDRIIVDRYLPPVEEEGGGAAAPGSTDVVVIPTDDLRPLNVIANLEIAAMEFAGIRSSDVKVKMQAKDGKLRFHPASARLYGGSYSGNVGLDVSGAKPRLTLDEKLTGVRFGDLSRDLYDVQKLSGLVTGNVTLSATGETIDELRSTLDGNAGFVFADGAFEGTDLWYEIRKALAVVKGQAAPAPPETARTPFSDMRGTAVFKEGVMRNEDFDAKMPFMRVTGAGQMNLVDRGVDYQVRVRFVRSPELAAGAEQFVGQSIPVRISGTLTEPKVRPDVQAYLKDRATEKVDEVKDKVRDKLLDRLGLPPRKPAAPADGSGKSGDGTDGSAAPAEDGKAPADAPAEKQELAPKEQLEEKVRDKLKGLLGG